jgi:hypothetical protein
MSSAIVLMTIAGMGVLYEVLHRFTTLDKHFIPEEALIFLVSILCGGLGAERLLTLKKIEDDIEKAREQRLALIKKTDQISTGVGELLRSTGNLRVETVDDLKAILKGEKDIITGLKRIIRAEALIGTSQIELAATQLVDGCEDDDRIKATGQYRFGDGLSHAYFQRVADRVARAKKNNGSMEYWVVVASTGVGKLSDDDPRIMAFKRGHIRDRLHMRSVKHSWPFEVLIGGHSIIVALLSGDVKSKYEAAVKITDPDFVKSAENWFGDVVWADADKT